jgi:hypothetical protein
MLLVEYFQDLAVDISYLLIARNDFITTAAPFSAPEIVIIKFCFTGNVPVFIHDKEHIGSS